MHLIDRTPGGFYAVIGLVVYGVIGIEAAMILTGSYVVMALVLLVIAAIAAAAVVFMNHLLEDATGDGTPAEAEAVKEPAPVVRAPARTGSTRRTGTGRPAHVA